MAQVVMPDLVEVAVVTVAMGDMEVEVGRIAEMQALVQGPATMEEQLGRVAEVVAQFQAEEELDWAEQSLFDKEEV
ncbi:hypothetical protein [Nitrospira sp. M1]